MDRASAKNAYLSSVPVIGIQSDKQIIKLTSKGDRSFAILKGLEAIGMMISCFCYAENARENCFLLKPENNAKTGPQRFRRRGVHQWLPSE
jgi:hypothetical protein